MRTPSGRIAARLGLFAALAAFAAAPLHAAPENGGNAAVEAARDIWEFIQQIRGEGPDTLRATRAPSARPQAVPAAGPDGPTIDLSDLSHPLTIEEQLARFAELPDSELRLSVPGGSARLGAFSIGSEQSLQGNLLILKGNAEVFGRLEGNLV